MKAKDKRKGPGNFKFSKLKPQAAFDFDLAVIVFLYLKGQLSNFLEITFTLRYSNMLN